MAGKLDQLVPWIYLFTAFQLVRGLLLIEDETVDLIKQQSCVFKMFQEFKASIYWAAIRFTSLFNNFIFLIYIFSYSYSFIFFNFSLFLLIICIDAEKTHSGSFNKNL